MKRMVVERGRMHAVVMRILSYFVESIMGSKAVIVVWNNTPGLYGVYV